MTPALVSYLYSMVLRRDDVATGELKLCTQKFGKKPNKKLTTYMKRYP